jgi:hypothetical protein
LILEFCTAESALVLGFSWIPLAALLSPILVRAVNVAKKTPFKLSQEAVRRYKHWTNRDQRPDLQARRSFLFFMSPTTVFYLREPQVKDL